MIESDLFIKDLVLEKKKEKTQELQKVLEYSNIYEQHDNLIIPSIYFVKDGKIISYYHLDDECKIDCLLKKNNQSKIKKDIKLLIDTYQSA